VSVSVDLFRLDRHLAPGDARAALAADVRAGLTGRPKWLPPKWFYDAAGSRLFDEITRLPEYYPTRTERALLAASAADIAARSGATTLVELGSGTSEKTRLLLDALRAAGTLRSFVPFDVDATVLAEAAGALCAAYPGLAVHGVVGDFERHLPLLPRPGRRLVAFLGGTIGNLPPAARRSFLAELRGCLAPGEGFLLGVDLVKDAAILQAAYDDAAGVTAAFNRNVLRVLDREAGAAFDPADFDHVAVWNAAEAWIEMRLRARRDLTVPITSPELGLDLVVELAAGEDILTEISAKFTVAGIEAELAAAGFDVLTSYTDGVMALVLAAPAAVTP
jgi:L-histidine N-alpha-methyltransferase